MRVVSIHLPKTGGTTLAHALRSRFSDGYAELYSLTPWWGAAHAGDLSRRVRASARYAALRTGVHQASCIHGHVPASWIARRDDFLLTFIRDPVERSISEWRYIHRETARMPRVWSGSWKPILRQSLEEFLASKVRRFATYYDLPPERFDFVGHMDAFDADFRRLGETLGLDPAPPGNFMAAPGKSAATPELRRIFEASNPGEMELYERMCERRAALLCKE